MDARGIRVDAQQHQEKAVQHGALRRRSLIAGVAAMAAAVIATSAESVGATSGGGPDGTLVMGSNFGSGGSPNTVSRLTVQVPASVWSGSTPTMFGFDATVAGNAPADTTALYAIGKGSGAGLVGSATTVAATPVTGLNAGVYGLGAANKVGVSGANLSTVPNSHAILAVATAGHGLVGSSLGGNTYAGLVGNAGPNGARAGAFYGDVVFSANFFVLGNQTVYGAKSAALPTADGKHRLVYCIESPESWLEDFGRGTLVDGRAEVKIDAVFAAVAEMADYHVFLTPSDATSRGLAATARRADGFTVQELGGGASGGTFSYRVVARRKDVPAARLAAVDKPTLAPLHLPDLAPAIPAAPAPRQPPAGPAAPQENPPAAPAPAPPSR
jgi:hypothetical protein